MLTAPADLNEIPDQINWLPHPQECEEVYENFADCRHEQQRLAIGDRIDVGLRIGLGGFPITDPQVEMA